MEENPLKTRLQFSSRVGMVVAVVGVVVVTMLNGDAQRLFAPLAAGALLLSLVIDLVRSRLNHRPTDKTDPPATQT